MSAVEIINPPKSEVEWVVKVSTVPLNGYLKMKTKAHFQNTQYTEDMILLLIFGLLVGNSVFNFILYFIIKDRIYLLSALYSFSFFIYQLLDKNVGKFLFYGWIDITHYNYHISTMFSSTSALTSVILSQKFLRLPEKIKYFKTVSNIILFSGIALLVFHLFNVEVKWKRVLSVYFGLICMVHILCMFVYTVRFKTRESFLFLFSYLPIFIGVIFFMLTRYGVLALPHISDQLLVIAAVFDAIFLSAGLADRINVLKEEKTEIELKSLKELGAIAIRMGDSLNTPLNVISLCVEEIKDNEKSKEFSEEMDLIKKQVHHINISLEPLKHYRSYSSHAVLVEPHSN